MTVKHWKPLAVIWFHTLVLHEVNGYWTHSRGNNWTCWCAFSKFAVAICFMKLPVSWMVRNIHCMRKDNLQLVETLKLHVEQLPFCNRQPRSHLTVICTSFTNCFGLEIVYHSCSDGCVSRIVCRCSSKVLWKKKIGLVSHGVRFLRHCKHPLPHSQLTLLWCMWSNCQANPSVRTGSTSSSNML